MQTYKLLFSLSTAFILYSCTTNNNTQTVTETSIAQVFEKDSFLLQTSSHKADTSYNEYMQEELKLIRANFQKSNSIDKWDSVPTRFLDGSTEGGEGKFYYKGSKLVKVITRYFGETFQLLNEYYLLDDKPFFVFEKRYQYNRPLYHDSAAMKEMNDTQSFHLEASEIYETRNYFQKGKLIHQIFSHDCPAPYSEEYLKEEQKRISEDFAQLLVVLKENTE